MKLLRDVTEEFRMPADSYAAIFETNHGIAVAWGRAYDSLANDKPYLAGNTDEHGVTYHSSIAAAEKEVAKVAEAHASVRG